MNPDLGASQPNALDAAVHWIEMTLVGSIATSVAIICVAGFGLMMFAGRLPTRRGVQIILGCFIIFGASSIASGLMRSLIGVEGGAPDGPVATEIPSSPPLPIVIPPRASAAPYDPYAGAALPPRH